MYYAAESDHGSSTSRGFANDWTVYAFNNKGTRDKFVATRSNLSTIAIKRDEVTRHATNVSLTHGGMTAPEPFTGDYWGINTWAADNSNIPGLIGTVERCDAGSSFDRFYR